jgi:large subunit ribosomal protein L3
MTQVFDKAGEMVPVTVLEVGPCTVVQKKAKGTDGYESLQLGFMVRKPKGMPKPLRGHFEKKKLPLFRHLKEFRTEKAAEFEVGEELLATAFKAGERVHVTGISKGRGFQGVMKRHNKHGGPASHGSNFRRRPGSIGMRTMPARVPKNTRLPGHMGDVQVTTKGLEVMEVRGDDNLVFVRGAVPGCTNGILFIAPAGDVLDGREGLRKAEAKAPEKAEAPAETEAKVEEKAEAPAEEKVEEKATEKTEEKPKE